MLLRSEQDEGNGGQNKIARDYGGADLFGEAQSGKPEAPAVKAPPASVIIPDGGDEGGKKRGDDEGRGTYPVSGRQQSTGQQLYGRNRHRREGYELARQDAVRFHDFSERDRVQRLFGSGDDEKQTQDDP